MKKIWIVVAAVVLIAGATGYALAQTSGVPQGGPGGMMGAGSGMMGEGMMGQGGTGHMGQMMGVGMMNLMSGQPLTPEQVEQFAKLHGITVEQAQQMTQACTTITSRSQAPQGQSQQ